MPSGHMSVSVPWNTHCVPTKPPPVSPVVIAPPSRRGGVPDRRLQRPLAHYPFGLYSINKFAKNVFLASNATC